MTVHHVRIHMSGLEFASVAIGLLNYIREGGDERIRIDASLEQQLKSWGVAQDGLISKVVSVFDISRDGGIRARGGSSVDQEATVRSELPELGSHQTRLFLKDLYLQIYESSTDDKALIPGKLIHEQGEYMSDPTFEALQTSVSDSWNLQSLWRSTPARNTCPFYLQTNTLESLLRTPSSLTENTRQSRLVLFFGRYTIELWQCLSSVRTTFLSGDRVEGTLYYSIRHQPSMSFTPIVQYLVGFHVFPWYLRRIDP